MAGKYRARDPFLFSAMKLSAPLTDAIRRMNPWWEGKPTAVLPATTRHLVTIIKSRLGAGLAPIVVVRGPRQIGKSTAQMQVVADLLEDGVAPQRILHVQFDELKEILKVSSPILRIVRWYEDSVLGGTLNEFAHRQLPTYIFLDEVQNLDRWAPQLKHLVDHSTTQVLVTGSSALRIERGRDSLAGRISTIEAGVLSLTEIAKFHRISLGNPFLEENGLDPLIRFEFWKELAQMGRTKAKERDETFHWFSERGGYPLAHKTEDSPWGLLADQLNETVIRRVIQHDLRIGDRGRKRDEKLLEEVFRMACRYVGQTPSAQVFVREARATLGANVGIHRIQHYLRFLGDTLLLRLINPLEIRLRRSKGSPKICLADHGLRASWLQEVIPIAPADLDKQSHLAALAGRIAESVTGTTLSTISSLDIAHLPERNGEPEVDFVLTIGTRRIPLEVKYQRTIDFPRDAAGLESFMTKPENNAPFGILITRDELACPVGSRVVAMPLSSLMLLR